jgi:uncharacterized protein
MKRNNRRKIEMPETALTIEQIIQALGLQPLPVEGGLFRETYKAKEILAGAALPARYHGQEKPYGTAIYYLLTGQPDSFSAFHRLPTDEVYHFYLGDPLELYLLYPDGSFRQVILGQELLSGQQVQFTVPRGTWQGSRIVPGGRYALVGTTMAPGFTPSDYEGGERAALQAQYPDAAGLIRSLTR